LSSSFALFVLLRGKSKAVVISRTGGIRFAKPFYPFPQAVPRRPTWEIPDILAALTIRHQHHAK
jgi:hypothetical protein